MPSKIAMGTADRLMRTGASAVQQRKIAELIDSAIQESCKPLVEAVEKYAEWCEDEEGDWNPIIAKQVYDDLLSEARKLKEVK
jgi:hypothetical protein